ncbi:MAG: hypothetical protein ACAI35_26150 [Candidatus Methylacidiphilales bacterium]|nr:hypothetical protein [Candidatus Methylacidiphilales bacterium]
MSTSFFLPGPNYGYRIVKIGDHPWNALVTMKEIMRLDPGIIRFVGPGAERHEAYWKDSMPQLFDAEVAPKGPVFEIDVTTVHPHAVEIEPRRPFQAWKD